MVSFNALAEHAKRQIAEQDNFTLTENGAYALKTTGDDLVNLFGIIGSLRSRSEREIEELFTKAMNENPLLATKMTFYARNIRGGLGERKVPRFLWSYMAVNYPTIMAKNIHLIPHFGRWDDLYIFVGTELENAMWDVIREQIAKDLRGMQHGELISLMAKWLKSVNTSSTESRNLGKLTAKALGLDEKTYRKTLSAMRRYLDIIEVKMSEGDWGNIEFPKVPSKAMAKYRKAFARHTPEKFQEYVDKVVSGAEKVNASTLYPYDLMRAMGLRVPLDWSQGGRYYNLSNPEPILLEQWKALPNYIDGEHNVLIMADTSGSMTLDGGTPIMTSIGLAVYFAERNKGAFKNLFMTFSSEPNFVELRGDTLEEKIKCIPEIVDNTNLEAAFKLLLHVAVVNNIPPSEMPKAIVVISDMEIDEATYNPIKRTFYDFMKQEFKNQGYEIPNVVFWNVASRQNIFHASSHIKGVQLASGSSVSVFKTVLANLGKTPYEAMLTVLNDPIYDVVTI